MAGITGIKYCVASVYLHRGEAYVNYHAFLPGPYGHHLTQEIEDPAVIWYDTREQALANRRNDEDCVLAMLANNIPKFMEVRR